MTPPPEPLARFALRGRVVTMDAKRRTLGDGVVYVDAGRITAVLRATAPPPAGFEAVTPLATKGTIYPGLIELHNHLAYNALPLWRPPGRYTNRDRWQGTVGYRRYVSGPAWELGRRPEAITATIRYVEAKSLIAGVTTSQGITLRGLHLEHTFQGVVRNCEVPDDPDLAPADPKITDVAPGEAASFRATLGGPRARLLHLAEGTDASALAHFEALRIAQDDWAISQWLAGIHATALGPAELSTLQANGGHIVWSPFSNLALYGETTKIAEARELGITIALGSDWSPSGTKNLLAEMKVAHLATGLDARTLVEMATVNPAVILGWSDHVGSLEAGKVADVVVVAGTKGDAYGKLMLARESDIALVVIAGIARYGTPELMGPLVPPAERETFTVAGASRAFQRPPAADPVVGPLPALEDAVASIRDVLNNLPERAKETIDPGLAPRLAMASPAGPETRLVLALDLEPTPPAPTDLRALAAGAAGSYADIAVPLEIDALTTLGDAAFFAQLANLGNLSDDLRSALPPLYGETPRPPAPAGLEARDDAEPVASPEG